MKIAIITGASSGMGREAARQIADRFSGIQEVWLISRRLDRMQELEKTIPVTARCFSIDLTDEAQLESLKKELEMRKPDVKILVNASGFGKIGKIGELPLGDESGMIKLNCEALCTVTHMVIPYMSDNSRILQFASAASFLPQPGFAVYAATKAFVLSYSRALRIELRSRRIGVTAVCPGPVKTEFFDIAETTGQIPLYKRLVMADPHKVVKLAIRDCMAGKSVSVYGYLMKAFCLLCKVLPHDFILNIMQVFNH